MEAGVARVLASPAARAFLSRAAPEGRLARSALTAAVSLACASGRSNPAVVPLTVLDTYVPHDVTPDGFALGEALAAGAAHPLLPPLNAVHAASGGGPPLEERAAARRFALDLRGHGQYELLEFCWLRDGSLLLVWRWTVSEAGAPALLRGEARVYPPAAAAAILDAGSIAPAAGVAAPILRMTIEVNVCAACGSSHEGRSACVVGDCGRGGGGKAGGAPRWVAAAAAGPEAAWRGEASTWDHFADHWVTMRAMGSNRVRYWRPAVAAGADAGRAPGNDDRLGEICVSDGFAPYGASFTKGFIGESEFRQQVQSYFAASGRCDDVAAASMTIEEICAALDPGDNAARTGPGGAHGAAAGIGGIGGIGGGRSGGGGVGPGASIPPRGPAAVAGHTGMLSVGGVSAGATIGGGRAATDGGGMERTTMREDAVAVAWLDEAQYGGRTEEAVAGTSDRTPLPSHPQLHHLSQTNQRHDQYNHHHHQQQLHHAAAQQQPTYHLQQLRQQQIREHGHQQLQQQQQHAHQPNLQYQYQQQLAPTAAVQPHLESTLQRQLQLPGLSLGQQPHPDQHSHHQHHLLQHQQMAQPHPHPPTPQQPDPHQPPHHRVPAQQQHHSSLHSGSIGGYAGSTGAGCETGGWYDYDAGSTFPRRAVSGDDASRLKPRAQAEIDEIQPLAASVINAGIGSRGSNSKGDETPGKPPNGVDNGNANDDDDDDDDDQGDSGAANDRRAPASGGSQPEAAGSNTTCDICDTKFSRPSNLRRHRQTLHMQVRKTHKCRRCDRSFPSLMELRRHSARHDAPRPQCPQCGLRFRLPAALDLHIAVSHARERPFSCSMCGLAFARKSAMDRHHKSVHQRQRHTCEHCGISYSQPFDLKRHRARTGHEAPADANNVGGRGRGRGGGRGGAGGAGGAGGTCGAGTKKNGDDNGGPPPGGGPGSGAGAGEGATLRSSS